MDMAARPFTNPLGITGKLLAVLCLGFGIAATPAAANLLSGIGPNSPRTAIAEVGASSAPMIGWLTFCEAQPVECSPKLLRPARVSLTSRAWDQLTTINRTINRAITPVADDEHYGIYRMGIRNWWTYPDDGKGNCNDYVLLKRKLLVEAGWPQSALPLTVVRTPSGEGHLVLMIKSDHGDLILDNLRDDILSWDLTGYEFIKRQADTDHNLWVAFRFRHAPAAVAGAVRSDVSSR
jgi:predicted transglutaminase-like cysteine proteinase